MKKKLIRLFKILFRVLPAAAKTIILLSLPIFMWAQGHWMSESGETEIVYQTADSSIRDEYATKDVVPRLEFHCMSDENSITARIDWKRFISSFSTEVGFKKDGGKFTWLKWKVDDSEKVTYSPSATDTEKLIAAIDGGENLLVDIAPYSEAPIRVNFDLNGFSAALKQLKNSCR